MKFQNILRSFFLFVYIFLVGSIYSYAENVYPTNGLSVNSGTFKLGDSCTVNDGLPSSTTYGITRGIVTLGIDWSIIDYNAVFTVDSSFVAEIIVNIKGWSPAVTTPSNGNYTTNVTETLKVIYNPRQNVTEIDKAVYTLSNLRQLKARITGIKINGIPVTTTTAKLPQSLYLTTDLEVERYKTFNTATTPSLSSITNLNNNQLRVTWGSITGAEDYDVEWTWVDALAPQNYDFTHNSSRVTVPASSGTSYIIPNAYPNGKIVIRVRGRGRDLTIAPDFSRHTFGTWSIAAAGALSGVTSSTFTISTGLEEEKNWQYTTTFSEQGKRQDVIQYFDGTLRNRQSITRLNVLDSAALVGETFYDHIGRPAIRVLPVPHVDTDTSYNHLYYRELFNRDVNDQQFTYEDFDTNDSNNCDGLIVNPMSIDYGASYYYSENNPLQSTTPGNIYNYLPKAQGFPYTQVEYMPDNTNRIRRQSGVGVTHRLTGTDVNDSIYTGKETKYYYGTPFQVQLDRLFGSEVGRYKHYKKNLVIDANGQISVSYIDPYGRVIATALAGDTVTTPNLLPLASSNSSANLDCNLLDSMQIDYSNMSIVSTATHLVTSPGIHSFTYSVATPSYKTCLPPGWCFDCIYDLTISIKDECGIELVDDTIGTQTVGSIYNTTCDSITFTLNPDPLEIELENPGNYVITKILKVNQNALNYYTQQFLDSSTCILSLQDFINDAMEDIDTTECYGGCQDCLDRLGDYSEHNDTSQRFDADYDYMTMDEYDHALEVCNSLCDMPTPCDALYKQILADVSPGGQYMEYDLSGYTYTVADTLSLLNISFGALGNYTEVTTYEDSDGSPSVISIDGLTYNAENLPVNLFLQHWQESWAASLAPLHPEYCYYEACAANEDSYMYDNNMLLTSTFEAARDSGFLNPIGSNTDTVPFHIEHKDPFFAPYSGTLYTSMLNALDDYVGVDTTAWELIELMQNTNNSYSGNGDCWTDYDWGLFRTAYLSTKQTFLQAMYDGLTGCFNFGTYPNNPFAMGTKTPRFIFNTFGALGNENLTGYDLSTNSSSDPQDIQDEALANIEGYCDTICTSYAETWMYNLMGCGLSDPDSIEIRSRLITVCRGNCNGTTPLGGIEEDEVNDILEDVLGPSYADADCNPLSIVQPVDHGPGAFGMLPADSCACDKVLNAHIQFDTLTATGNLPMGICSEQDMFTYLYGPDANGVNMDQLECYCLKFYDNDTIITSTASGPVTTILAPDCDLFNAFNHSADTITANSYLTNLINFFNQHWEKDSCEEGTFFLEDLSLPVGFLNQPGDCFTSYTTDNTYVTDTVYIYFNPDSALYIEDCDWQDSIELIGSGMYYINDTNYVSLLESQTITFHNPCGSDCEMIISAPPCLEGNLYCASYLYCDNDLQLTFFGGEMQDSIFNDCVGGYYSPFGTGLYALLGSPPFNGHGDGKFMIWTDCFNIGDTIIYEVINQDVLYVPASLACEQCMNCSTFVDAYTQLFTDYPFVSGLFADDSTYNIGVHYIVDYVNDLYNQNFSIYQIDQFNQQCMSSGDPDTLELCYEPMFTTYNDPHQECVDFLIATALSNAENNYHAYIDSVSAAFRQEYITKCLGAFETFNMEYTEREFHYTLYYYDQAGNLIKTVPPEGVSVITDTLILDSVELHRNHPLTYPNRVIPDHELITDYRYTTLNQPARQHTPDGGITQYWYDILGRLVVSQNAKQAGDDKYSYTKYDDLGRIVEVGEVQHDTVMTPAHAANIAYLTGWLNAGTKTQVTSTYYDATPITGLPFSGTGNAQKNLRNRIAYTTFEETYDGTDTIYDVATHYSYDIHGNVFELVQDVVALDDQGARYKLIQYSYDLISGKVLEVKYQHGEKDQFYHKYEYTHDNKLIKAKTSRDHVIWDEDASYQYYMYGALARTEMGDNNVQGVDYAYTIHGWIKGTNSNTLTSSRDIGKDGYKPTSGPANAHQNFCIDVAAFSLGYYRQTNGAEANDYQSIGSFTTSKFFIASIDTLSNVIATNQKSLFNGNISHMVTTIPNCSTFTASQTFTADPLGTVYRYDQLNRIKWMNAYSDIANVNSLNRWGTSSTNNGKTYHSNFKYDANGNLTNLGRWGNRSDSLLMDSLTYGYSTSSDPYYSGQQINRLDTIAEHQNSRVRYNNDLDNDSYYSYDEIGNLIEDTGEEIDEIEWTVYGKVKKVTRATGSTKPDLEFKYNSNGQRYCKIVKPRNSAGILNQGNWTYTYYTHDAQGNIMTMYRLDYEKTATLEFDENYKIANFNLYGSSRLGIKNDTVLLNKREIEVDALGTDSSFTTLTTSNVGLSALDTNRMKRITGYKNYEISNHLGNVLATITDRKVPIPTAMDTIVNYWTADINTLTDYYPFGSEMPGRNLMISSCTSEIAIDTFTVVDEQFASGTGGFGTIGSGVTLTNASGLMKVTKAKPAASGWGTNRTFSQINGVEYTVSLTLTFGTCTGTTIAVNIKNNSGSVIATHNYTSNGTYSFTFTGNQTGNGSIEIIEANTSQCSFSIDNVLITYPYEQVVTNCSNDTNSYMFGFGGQLKDDEVYGSGNAYTAEFWEYDPRTCRRWNRDPLGSDYAWQSPYATFNNNPILIIDPTGLKGESTGVKQNDDGTYTVVDARNDGDKGIYVVGEDGKYDTKTSEKIGETMEPFDFMTEDAKTGTMFFDPTFENQGAPTIDLNNLTISGSTTKGGSYSVENADASGLIQWGRDVFKSEQLKAKYYGIVPAETQNLIVLKNISANGEVLDLKVSLGLPMYTPVLVANTSDGVIITTLRAVGNYVFGENLRSTYGLIAGTLLSGTGYYSETMKVVGGNNQKNNGGNGYNSGFPYYGENTYSGTYIYKGFFGAAGYGKSLKK